MSFDDYTGFITPFVLEKIMGSTGAYLLITSITMALMSTGSGEVMAVSSIVVYDIYKVYINPFRYLASLFGGDGGCGETVYVAYVIFAVGGFLSYCNSKISVFEGVCSHLLHVFCVDFKRLVENTKFAVALHQLSALTVQRI